MKKLFAVMCCILSVWPCFIFCQENSNLLTLDAIFASDTFKLKKPKPIRFLADGKSYTVLEPSETMEDASDIIMYDAVTGERQILVSASALIPPDDSTALTISDYKLCPQTRYVLIFTNTRKVWRLHTRGDYWALDRENHTLRQLGKELEPASLMFATFAPDFHKVAYVSKNNLYVEELDNSRVHQLTQDGSDTIINGTSDWVYEEEFRLRHGFRWSPDSDKIAFWQFDTKGVKDFYIINNTDSLYPTITTIPYPKAGTQNSLCRIGVVSLSSDKTIWIENPTDQEYYIPYMEWANNSREIIFQRMNRLQNRNDVVLAEVEAGRTTVILEEADDAWLDLVEKIEWLDDGTSFLWLSERAGRRHAYKVSRSGKKVKLLTPGDFDLISVCGIDKQNRWLYFIASPENPTQRYLYRASLDGTGKMERISPKDQPGTHTYTMSPNANLALHSFSTALQPPIYDIIHLPDHTRVKELENNQELAEKCNAIIGRNIEFFRIKTDAAVLDAWEIRPYEFDANRKYPVLFFVYGEPHGSTVNDRWYSTRHLWFQMLAQQGCLVMSIDSRGTGQPRGREWRKIAYKNLGIISTKDQVDALAEILKMKPYVDSTRVAMWGWSGGGSATLNALFRYPDVYHLGMAVAPVADLRYYDTVYQERYMGLPQDDPEAYRDCSPITFAHQLQGKLLLIHGTGDDNVHYQGTEALINELIKHNKQFSMMSYPNRTHGIREGEGTTLHLYTTMTRFLFDNLRPGGE